MKKIVSVCLLLSGVFFLNGQNIPDEYTLDFNTNRLTRGTRQATGLYNDRKIRRVDITFTQSNYRTILTQNYNSKTDLAADLTMDGVTYKGVGVRYKGQTSYQRVSGDKKSFDITLDYTDKSLDIDGYEVMNFNNSFEDNSYMREVFYENYTHKYSPSLKAAYVHLYINGEDYGLYPHVQGLDGTYIKEWFLNNNGARWRCERTTGGAGGGGFGAGTSTLNYLGDDTTLYKPHYTLNHTEITNPWFQLMKATKVLATSSNVDSLQKAINIDQALWFLAKEILFGDDDSYINKGGMDYHAYYDVATGRLIPLEYDANSVMSGNTSSWDIFLKQANAQFPLANKLFNIPELRQRYLAHVRTMMNDLFDPVNYNAKIDTYFNLIDTLVNKDPKKLMTYAQFTAGRDQLKTWMNSRRTYLQNHTEIKQTGVKFIKSDFYTNNIIHTTPNANETVTIKTQVDLSIKTKACYLYFGTGYDGVYTKLQMYDDGAHNDEKSGDGIFASTLPAQPKGTYVRFYTEAIADNGFNTASYFPEGAEHDVFIYRVNLEASSLTDVVINEVVSANKASAKDQDNEYDDWIELYNNSAKDINITRWILTDNTDNLDKYRFPSGTVIKANSYLIVWADEDGKQNGLHANFKLSSDGEPLLLLDSTGKQIDLVQLPALKNDEAYARIPNGTGNFIKTTSYTFNKNNTVTTAARDFNENIKIKLYPNPAYDQVTIENTSNLAVHIKVYNLMGQQVYNQKSAKAVINTSHWPLGAYIAQIENKTIKFIVH